MTPSVRWPAQFDSGPDFRFRRSARSRPDIWLSNQLRRSGPPTDSRNRPKPSVPDRAGRPVQTYAFAIRSISVALLLCDACESGWALAEDRADAALQAPSVIDGFCRSRIVRQPQSPYRYDRFRRRALVRGRCSVRSQSNDGSSPRWCRPDDGYRVQAIAARQLRRPRPARYPSHAEAAAWCGSH